LNTLNILLVKLIMPNIALISNMNYRRRFNSMSKESFTETDMIESTANNDDIPTVVYTIKLFILAYFSMIAIDIMINIVYLIIYLNDKSRMEKNKEPNSPDMTPPTPPASPASPASPNTTRPVTRSMSTRRRKKGLNLFS
jgi:hypothetical protein